MLQLPRSDGNGTVGCARLTVQQWEAKPFPTKESQVPVAPLRLRPAHASFYLLFNFGGRNVRIYRIPYDAAVACGNVNGHAKEKLIVLSRDLWLP